MAWRDRTIWAGETISPQRNQARRIWRDRTIWAGQATSPQRNQARRIWRDRTIWIWAGETTSSRRNQARILNTLRPLKILQLHNNSNQTFLTNSIIILIPTNILTKIHNNFKILTILLNASKTIISTHNFKNLERMLFQTTKTSKNYTKNKPIALLLQLVKIFYKFLISRKRKRIWKNCKV